MTSESSPDLAVEVLARPPGQWQRLLDACPGADFFHTNLWTRLVCRNVAGHVPLWLVARRGGRLVAGMAAVRRRQWLAGSICSHFEGTTGGPLLAPELNPSQQERVFTLLLRQYSRLLGGRVGHVNVTLSAAQEERFGPLLRAAGWRRREVRAALMPLAGGLAHVEMKVLKKNRRNERNRSLKRGCVPGVTTDPQVLAEYYPIYRAAAARWGMTPVPEGLLRDLLVEGEGRAFLSWVRFAGKVIGGHLNLHRGQRVTAWNGATLPEHNHLFPATLLVWTDLEEACRRGAAWLDLGGSSGQTKLANFKKLLGAQEEVRGHYQLTTRLYRFGSALRRQLAFRGARS